MQKKILVNKTTTSTSIIIVSKYLKGNIYGRSTSKKKMVGGGVVARARQCLVTVIFLPLLPTTKKNY